jgi:hypothetical protein
MPRYSFDEGIFEEYGEYMDPASMPDLTRSEDGELSYYQPAEGQLAEDKLSGLSREVLAVLRDLGATEILVRYDGGYDEGFAYFDSATVAGESHSVDALSEELASGSLGEEPKERIIHYSPEVEATMTRAHRAKDALDCFAGDLAGQLLGNGFGTGEAGIEGRFRADLKTGLMVDIADETSATE